METAKHPARLMDMVVACSLRVVNETTSTEAAPDPACKNMTRLTGSYWAITIDLEPLILIGA